MAELVEVLARGKLLSGWRSVRISRAIDTAAGLFEIESPARSPYPLAPGDEVEILVGGELLLRGHAEVVERSLGPNQASVTCAGRDRTADLVDCSAANVPGEWSNISLPDLAKALASPYGIGVDYTAGPRQSFDTYKLRPGDTAWGALERACRLRGVLVYSDGTGRLVMREAGRGFADVELVEGENVLAATFTVDDTERHRTYIVQGQRPGSDLGYGDSVALVEGRASDLGARAQRQLLILAEATVTNQTAAERAQWESTVRAARAVRVNVTVNGWRQQISQAPGRLWTFNEQVAVRCPSLDLDRYLLVRAVTFTHTAQREVCELELVREDAYQVQPNLSLEDDALSEWLQNTSAGEDLPDDVLDPAELDQ